MSDPLQAILNATPLTTSLFGATSRYHGVEIATLELDDRTISYLRRRFVPASDRFALLHEHIVTAGDRLDNIAAQDLGDPELFWRIADANDAIRPDELIETVGRRLRITLPEGIQGTQIV